METLYNDRIFGIDMTSRASRRRCPSGRTENWHWTNRGVPLRLAEKYASYYCYYCYLLLLLYFVVGIMDP